MKKYDYEKDLAAAKQRYKKYRTKTFAARQAALDTVTLHRDVSREKRKQLMAQLVEDILKE